jgi:hypothetical protein
MKKQTAVEWLVEQVNADCLNSTFIRKELIDKAIEIEKSQTEEASLNGIYEGYCLQIKRIEQRAYSDEEVYNILLKHTESMFKGERITLDKWFEQNKKKQGGENEN